ncbi:hypothetical protein LINGRAHAP2_LOCUS16093, partial [Linum grandiflorum]
DYFGRKSVQLFWPEFCLLLVASYLLSSRSDVLHLSSSFLHVFILQKDFFNSDICCSRGSGC